MSSKKRKVTVTAAELEKRSRKEAGKIIDLYLMCTIWALHTGEGFGKKRLDRVCNAIAEIADDIAEGRLTAEDIRRTVAKETGFEIK
jgi:hypothetical protein